MLWNALVLFLMSGCLAQVSFPEICPALETVTDFNIQKYVGVWYEAERYFARFEEAGKCIKATYTLNENGTVSVENSQISATSGAPVSIRGIATPIGSPKVAQLAVVFSEFSPGRASPYFVLGTDYENWAVVWSCRNSGTSSSRHSWILTRKRNPPSTVLEQAYHIIERNNVSRTHFIKTDQTNCELYKENDTPNVHSRDGSH